VGQGRLGGSHRNADHSVASGHLVFVSGPADLSAKVARRLVEQRKLADAHCDAERAPDRASH
jgi:hypothetical protein